MIWGISRERGWVEPVSVGNQDQPDCAGYLDLGLRRFSLSLGCASGFDKELAQLCLRLGYAGFLELGLRWWF